jgi:Cupin-like domain
MTGSSSTSGLHHDHHDNLYILLRGRKRFRLWSPNDTQNMYTYGTVAKVHPNGRINYTGQVSALHLDTAMCGNSVLCLDN